MGLSPVHIMAMVVLTVLTLMAIFLFVFTALSAWTEGSAFESVTQSVFVGGGGAIFSATREGNFQGKSDNLKKLASHIKERFDIVINENKKIAVRQAEAQTK